jgi:hypothetical protein
MMPTPWRVRSARSRRPTLLMVAGALLLAGCAVSPAAQRPTSSAEPSAVIEAIEATDIRTIDEGIEWARNLPDDVPAQELSAGINAIGELVPDLDIWFATSNEIGRALIQLNAEVLEEPSAAAATTDDLKLIIEDIEAAIEKGPNP